jgi:hypothetical protein
MRLYPKIKKQRDRIFLYIKKVRNSKHTTDLLKIGEPIVVEGGPSTGKTSFLQKTIKKLEANAERLQDSRKLELILYLMEQARSTIVGCTKFSLLNPKIKVRLNNATLHSLGAGADTFDITYFLAAIIIVFVFLFGGHHLIYLAAAFRYLFIGTRLGGRNI